MTPITALLLLVIGFALIIKSADELVDGASQLAVNHGISPMVIGLTLVAFGTSAPELMVSLVAAWQNNSALAIGNALGSNIANIGLVLGLTLLYKPIHLKPSFITREFPLLFVVMLATYLLIADGFFSLYDGLLLLLALALVLTFLAYRHDWHSLDELDLSNHHDISYPWVRVLIGMVLLPISAKLIVSASIFLARYFGVSELMIGLTIVALGTSLPEVVTSIAAARKGKSDLAIGNIVGSNMFNLIAVLPFVGIIAPNYVPQLLLQRDVPSMFVITVILLCIVLGRKKKLTRIDGVVLLALYIAYIALLVLSHR